MEKRQITRQELVAAALKLGARPGTIRQWFHRGIPYRWQIRLMEYFEGPVEISDWGPRRQHLVTLIPDIPPSLLWLEVSALDDDSSRKDSPSTDGNQGTPRYEVGYCKPPTTTRFQKGKSGTPRGRPKEAKDKLPAINEERMKSILIEEAYRAIKVRDGSREVTISDDTGGGPKHGAGGRERAGEIAAHVHCVAAGYGKRTEGRA